MHVFEFRNKDSRNGGVEGLRTLIIGNNYRAYEKDDGSVLLNDEERGYSFFPQETYEEFRKQFSLDWRKLVTSSSLPASISMSSL
ncbi:hypothetical protein HOT53_gp140 [Salmonella phage SH9]|uniref:Uncharacterized protein n=1 Tax=Salmonella phage SH9 TaxID=2025819 RepID=A0A249Y0V3_9CAUD|nr:hypothetical protein HOT53_gp140 [Salmonella phage SH9]ASZ77870.1 hypothetical protein [Salmonella phage SH9]